MIKKEIDTIYKKNDNISELKDIFQVLSISISLANGMVWKEKTKSYYKVIARELKEAFNHSNIKNMHLKEFRKKYLRIYIPNNSLIFLKNNLFEQSTKQLSVEEFLQQELVIIEQKELPTYLTSDEKEKLYQKLSYEEMEIINRNYNKQELNSSNFILNIVREDQEQLISILKKNGYYSITVEEYIDLLSTGKYNYNNGENDQTIHIFKNTFNQYILELGAYIAKEIDNYINQ